MSYIAAKFDEDNTFGCDEGPTAMFTAARGAVVLTNHTWSTLQRNVALNYTLAKTVFA